jgi:hypothetical protein
MMQRISKMLLLAPFMASSIGCGQAPGDDQLDVDLEPTAEITQAFSEASCSSAPTDQRLENSTPGTTVVGVTPTTYSNPKCFKGYLFDLGVLPSAFGSPQPPNSPYNVSVSWTDPWPRSQAQCATALSVVVYSPGFTWGPLTAESVWRNGACELGFINFSSQQSPQGPSFPRVGTLQINRQLFTLGVPYLGGAPVRLAVTARTAANSTQSVRVSYTHNVGAPPPPPCPGC